MDYARKWYETTRAEYPDVTDLDWARLAALIDGEGHIGVVKRFRKGSPSYYLTVGITNTDPRMLEWCRDKFGGNIEHGERGSHRMIFIWRSVHRRASSVLTGCLPFFLIKHDQAILGNGFAAMVSESRAQKGVAPRRLSSEDKERRELFKTAISELNGSRCKARLALQFLEREAAHAN